VQTSRISAFKTSLVLITNQEQASTDLASLGFNLPNLQTPCPAHLDYRLSKSTVMAAEMIAKATPKVIEYAPKAWKVGKTLLSAPNVNAALNVYKAATDYQKEHHKPLESTRPTKDGQSSDHHAVEGRSRHRHHRRPSETDGYSEQSYGQAQQGSAPPLPYPDSDFMVDPSLYVYNGARYSRRHSYTPTPGTADQDRQDYFGDQAMKGHEQALRKINGMDRRRSSVNQRQASASLDGPANLSTSTSQYGRDRKDGRRRMSNVDRGYLNQGPPTSAEMYPASPRASSGQSSEPPRPNYKPPSQGAQRMVNLVKVAQAGYPIPPPPMPFLRRDSDAGNIAFQKRPPMPSRISSSGRRGSLASSTGSGASSRTIDSRYGYSNMV
jgi:hypothetical protein